MKFILTEKPSVAKYIAEYLGAKTLQDGYYEGNDYCISWARGHLVTIGQAKDYGFSRWIDIPLPFFPDFQLFSISDKGAVALLRIHKKLMNTSDMVINATDAEREGELIFRYIYDYCNCSVPVKRLWINSLTKDSITEGFKNLKDSSYYDNLYLSAKARNCADWLVGINSTTRLSLKCGELLTIGRVQTPVLKLIVERTLLNRNFKPERSLHLALDIESDTIALNDQSFPDNDDNKQKLEYINLELGDKAKVIAKERKSKTEKPPKLYSLATLQIDANRKFSFNADKTLELAQSLYIKKLISYPRTDSDHLTLEMFQETKNLFDRFSNIRKGITYDFSKLSGDNKKVFNDSEVSDHHAIIPTKEASLDLSDDEKMLYGLVLTRFLACFSQDAVKNTINYTLSCGKYEYMFSCHEYKILGWKLLYGNSESFKSYFPDFSEGSEISCTPTIHCKQTTPKPLYNDASLIIAMNNAGKELEDENLLDLMKDRGLGTPATQASIIEKLIKNNYIKRKGKLVHSTSKGEALIEQLEALEMDITSVRLTADWENKINSIRNGNYEYSTFMEEIQIYCNSLDTKLNQLNVSSSKLFKNDTFGKCPKCKSGNVKEGKKSFYCSNFSDDNVKCDFHIFKSIANKKITGSILKDLLAKKESKKLKFKNKNKKQFEAKIVLQEDFKASLSFV